VLKLFSSFDSNSPNLNDPKNAVQAAAHTTLFEWFDQSVEARLWPKILSNGSDITFLMLVWFGS
jgi:hypothetical protein